MMEFLPPRLFAITPVFRVVYCGLESHDTLMCYTVCYQDLNDPWLDDLNTVTWS